MEPLIHNATLVPILLQVTYISLSLLLFFRYRSSNDCHLLLKQNSPVLAIALTVWLSMLLGMRSTAPIFGDSYYYRHDFEYGTSTYLSNMSWDKEWFFIFINTTCKALGMNYVGLFLVIEIGYIGFMLLANWKLLWENVWFAMLFSVSAFSFWGYSINGLRNGLACSMILSAIAFVADGKKKFIPLSIGLCILALGVHRSVILPIVCLVASLYLVKNVKWATYFWLFSIVVSLIAGDSAQAFFAGLGFDDRAKGYLSRGMEEGLFSHTGFRWDFLIYSAMPILLAWYIAVKRGIQDKVFNVLACTYILSNSFWVMVCRAAFSNRFAYLSWFMYPLVIAYAVIRLPIWEDQDRKAAMILLAHMGFTAFMTFIY